MSLPRHPPLASLCRESGESSNSFKGTKPMSGDPKHSLFHGQQGCALNQKFSIISKISSYSLGIVVIRNHTKQC